MKLRHVTPMLAVADVDRAIAFYRDVLGFTVLNHVGDWAALTRDGADVMLCLPNAHRPGGVPTGSLYFYDDDVEATYADLRERAPVVYGLETFAYGMREFAIEDPDGHVLQFGAEAANLTTTQSG